MSTSAHTIRMPAANIDEVKVHTLTNECVTWFDERIYTLQQRTVRGIIAMFIHSMEDTTARAQAIDALPLLSTTIENFRHIHSKQQSAQEHLNAADLTPQENLLLQFLMKNEGNVVSFEDAIRSCSNATSCNNSLVLNRAIGRIKKYLLRHSLGSVTGIPRQGYLFLSEANTHVPTSILHTVRYESSILLKLLLSQQPHIVPYAHIDDRFRAGHTKETSYHQSIANSVTSLNTLNNQHTGFIIQPERGEGYRILTRYSIPSCWLVVIKKLSLNARETDLLIHFLSHADGCISREEVMAFAPHEGEMNDTVWRRYMPRFLSKLRKVGIFVKTISEHHSRTIKGYQITKMPTELAAENLCEKRLQNATNAFENSDHELATEKIYSILNGQPCSENLQERALSLFKQTIAATPKKVTATQNIPHQPKLAGKCDR